MKAKDRDAVQSFSGKMARMIMAVAALIMFCFLQLPLHADGKMFVKEDIPVKEPYQRALILHQDGKQLMMIQPAVETAADNVAWVVPVPSMSEVYSTRPDMASRLFNMINLFIARLDYIFIAELLPILLPVAILLVVAARAGIRSFTRSGRAGGTRKPLHIGRLSNVENDIIFARAKEDGYEEYTKTIVKWSRR